MQNNFKYISLRIPRRIKNKILGGKQIIYKYEYPKDLELHPGSLIRLESDNKFLAWASINPNSKNFIRILSLNEDFIENMKEEFKQKLLKAKKYRERIGYEFHYRWIYSEADFMSGLIIDKYNEILVIQNLNPFFDNKIVEKQLIEAILDIDPSIKFIYRKDSNRNRYNEGLQPIEKELYRSEGYTSVSTIIKELNKKFYVNPVIGQKTGWFLDQRENRKIFRNISYGKILDVFSYSGGFGICSKGDFIEFIEKDKDAIFFLKKNIELNNLQDKSKIYEGNAFKIIPNLIKQNKKYDCIVLDPPAFLSTSYDYKSAIKSYALINSLAIDLIDEGYLITFSCSQDMKLDKLYSLIKDIIRKKRKRFELIWYGQQALDHKVIHPHKELEYLKGLFIEIF